MTSSKCSQHIIEVINLHDGDIVNHSILLVKGRVRQCCSKENIKLQLRLRNEDKFEHVSTSHISFKGEFKFLLDLEVIKDEAEEVKLTLSVHYCIAIFDLEIVYKLISNIYKVQPLFIICQDKEDSEDDNEETITNALKSCETIDLNLRLVQSIYAEKINAENFGRRTFALNKCCKFYSKLTCQEAWNLKEAALWDFFAEELLTSDEWGKNRKGKNSYIKFVAFIGCTRYDGESVAASGDFSYANIRMHLRAHAALGGGGLALFGSAYFYAWPQYFSDIFNCLRNETQVDVRHFPDDSNYRRTYGGVYATTLGAVCHELGHIFDLGHTQDGVMGTGFDYLNRVLIVDNLTESLPHRIISNISGPSPRITQFNKKGGSNFLEKYHEQKLNDCFYFTRNCAVILAHHKWLRLDIIANAGADHNNIRLDKESKTIISQSQLHPLKLIEVRCYLNSLVVYFYEQKNIVYRFQLSDEVFNQIQQKTHYIFIITTSGQTKRLECNE